MNFASKLIRAYITVSSHRKSAKIYNFSGKEQTLWAPHITNSYIDTTHTQKVHFSVWNGTRFTSVVRRMRPRHSATIARLSIECSMSTVIRWNVLQTETCNSGHDETNMPSQFRNAQLCLFHKNDTQHTHPLNAPLSWTTRVSRYQKGKTNLHFTGARDSEWQWHPLGHMQVCTSLQTDNHASTPPLGFLQAGCPSCRPTNSVKAQKQKFYEGRKHDPGHALVRAIHQPLISSDGQFIKE